MDARKFDPDRLKELIGEIESPGEEVEVVHEIDSPGRGSKSMADIAAAAVAAIEADIGPRRKYSTDERPDSARIGRTRRSYFLLALVVATAAWVGVRTLRPPPPPIPGDPVEVFAVLSPAARTAPALTPEWSAARADTGALGERECAVRIGGLIVELERAVARDDSTAQVYSDAIAALVAEVPDGAEVAALFASIEGARALESRHALAPFARAAPIALGAWLQGARVAALAGDAGFFASARSRETMRLLLAWRGVSPEVEAARDRTDRLLRRRGRPDFAALSGSLDVLQRELAN